MHFGLRRPKSGRKWPRNGFWPHLANGGKMARNMGKAMRSVHEIPKLGIPLTTQRGKSEKVSKDGFPGPASPRGQESQKRVYDEFKADLFSRLPCPSFPCLFGIPCFLSWRGFPCFFERFSLLFKEFLGFGRDKKSLFFGGFSLAFSKKTRKGRTGFLTRFVTLF